MAWLVVAAFGVLLTMLVVDRPLAAALASLPSAVPDNVGAVTNELKGIRFIALALAATLTSLLAFLAGPNRSRDLFREGSINAGFVLCATVLALVAASLLKFAIGRARPELLGLYGPYAFSPFSTAKEMTSFPSGETAMVTAFFGACASAARSRLGRTWAIVIFFPAILIAVSRVVVGAHYPSDVLAAIVLSALIVGWLYRVLRSRRAAIASGLDRQRVRLREALRLS